MPEYIYKARNKEGGVFEGSIEASDKEGVAEALRQKGLLLTQLSERNEKNKLNISLFGGVKLRDKILLVDNLRIMIKAGMPITRALEILNKQTKVRILKQILLDVYNDVKKGRDLASGFERYPRTFSELFINMLRVGEETGNLEKTLLYLSRQLKKTYELRSKIRNAMAYPAVILVALSSLAILVVVYVMPRITDVFEDMDVELPLATKMLIWFSKFLNNNIILIIIATILAIIGFMYFRKSDIGKNILHKMVLYFWPFHTLIKKINLAQFSRTLSSLIGSGIPVTTSLELSSNTIKNVWYKRAIQRVAKDVSKGAKIAELLGREEKLFPPIMIQIIQVGEETGTVTNTLDKLADFYEEDISNSLNSLSSIIEPLLMIIIGSGIGFIALAVISPIYSLVNEI